MHDGHDHDHLGHPGRFEERGAPLARDYAARSERKEELLHLVERNLEGTQRRTEDGREVLAETRLASAFAQDRDPGGKDPRARVEKSAPLQPARAVRDLAGKERVRPRIEKPERSRIVVRRGGERQGRMARKPERVVDESAQICRILDLSLLERRLEPRRMDECARRKR